MPSESWAFLCAAQMKVCAALIYSLRLFNSLRSPQSIAFFDMASLPYQLLLKRLKSNQKVICSRQTFSLQIIVFVVETAISRSQL
jgi:hypothetical protein